MRSAAKISISSHPRESGWVFDVSVSEGASATWHQVIMARDTFERLSGGTSPPEECVRRSFEFLLEREPKEAILKEFDIDVIGRYFPEYERELRRRLGR